MTIKNKKLFIVLMSVAAAVVITLAVVLPVVLTRKPKDAPPAPKGEAVITLSHSDADMVMGQTLRVTATVENSDALPEWQSSDTSVVTVQGGRITAVADGEAVVTATADGARAEVRVTVASTENVALNRDSAKVFKGQTVQISATVRKGLVEIDAAVQWEISDTSIATVDADGVVTGVKVGKAPVTLTARTASGASATCEIKVEDIVTISLSETALTLHPNSAATAELTATGKRGSYAINASSINWTSQSPDIVSVTVSGGKATLTAKKSGRVAITASVANSDETAVCVVDSWYAISSPADMEYLRRDLNGVFKLVNDIDFKGAIWDGVTTWMGDETPDSAYFGGTLDGQGYSIKNINIQAGWNNGIFGQTAPSCVIKNLSVVNLVNQDTSNKVGSIVSYNKGLIENCYLENELRSDSQSNWNSHGGIVACNAAQGVIRNCIVKVKASRTFKNSGAIVGYNCGAVENCYAICTDATLPMYAEWISSLGYFKGCGVFKDAQTLADRAELYMFSDKVWTVTGYDIPALYNYPRVAFDGAVTYFSQGKTYSVSPSNVKGVPIEWHAEDADGVLEITQNPDYSLTVAARRKGEAQLTAQLGNGSYAQTRVVVTGTVLSPAESEIALDYDNPSLADSAEITLLNDDGETVTNVVYSSTDPSVATVDADGKVTAVGAGECAINVDYGGDAYAELVKVRVTGWVQVSTPQQLQAMKDAISLNYCLVNDIDFGGSVFETITPWGNSDNDRLYFNGMFDGNGYTVSNVTVVGNNSGIWGRTATTAIIRNTVFDNIVFRAAEGQAMQETFGVVSFNTGIIQNCVVRAKATAGNSADYKTGGAVCGTNEFCGRIYNCIAYMDASEASGGYVASIMALCQGVAKDCIGIVTAAGAADVRAICFINSSSVVGCEQFADEAAAVAKYAPFGSFDARVWEIAPDALPALKRLSA